MIALRNLIKVVLLPLVFFMQVLPAFGILRGGPGDAVVAWTCAIGYVVLLGIVSDRLASPAQTDDPGLGTLIAIALLVTLPALLLVGLAYLKMGYAVTDSWQHLLGAGLGLRAAQYFIHKVMTGR